MPASPDLSTVSAVSAVAVVAHAACALLLAATFSHLARLFPRPYLGRWAVAWGWLVAALLAVRFYIASGRHGWWLVYLIAEWVFLAEVLVGCRELARGAALGGLRRFLWPGLLAGIIAAGGLIPLFPDFDSLFSVQAGVLAAGFGAGWVLLGGVPAARRSAGFHLMRAALGWLTVQFLFYVPAYALSRRTGWHTLNAWLGYSSLADLCAQLLLGFGMLFVIAEEAQRELALAVAELSAARDRLANEVYFDPLTRALNRHAFAALLTGPAGLPSGGHGALAMIDLDHLKEINDSFGHHAGDAAICAATDAVRRQLHGADLLFRWGGDEFLVLLPDCCREEAEERLAPLAAGAPFVAAAGEAERRLNLSWGIAEMAGATSQPVVDEAIARADHALYGRRAAARRPGGRPQPVPPPQATPR